MDTGDAPIYQNTITGQIRIDDFATFFRMNYSRVFVQIVWISRDRARAAELTQEAFTKLFLKWNKVKKYEHPESVGCVQSPCV